MLNHYLTLDSFLVPKGLLELLVELYICEWQSFLPKGFDGAIQSFPPLNQAGLGIEGPQLNGDHMIAATDTKRDF